MGQTYEYVSFNPTPKEQKMVGYSKIIKHGTSTIGLNTLNDPWILCYKHNRRDNGGIQIQPCIIKKDSDPGVMEFEDCMMSDSMIVNQHIKKMCSDGYHKYLESQAKPKELVDTNPVRRDVEEQGELPF